MDFRALTFQSDVTPFYYPLEYRDLYVNRSLVPDHVKNDEQEIMRSWADVNIVMERMEGYVFSGRFLSVSVV
jgi:hypothetical protein